MIIKFYSKVMLYARYDTGKVYDQYILGEGDDYMEELNDMIMSDKYNDDLAQYASKDYDGFDKNDVISITETIEGDYLVATCVLAEGATPDMPVKGNRGTTLKEALANFLEGQYSDGWGEGLADEELGTDEVEDEFADPNDYADEDGEVPDDWEDMVEDVPVYYNAAPWWSERESFYGPFKFEKVEVLD